LWQVRRRVASGTNTRGVETLFARRWAAQAHAGVAGTARSLPRATASDARPPRAVASLGGVG